MSRLIFFIVIFYDGFERHLPKLFYRKGDGGRKGSAVKIWLISSRDGKGKVEKGVKEIKV
jgi:hypothetical protein